MAIRLVDDLGAPAAVTAVNLGVKAMKPEWEEYATYLVCAAGYVSAFMNWGGTFMKNVGIAEFPIAAEKIYDRILKPAGTTQRSTSHLTTRRVSRYPAPTSQSPFSPARLV